MPKPDPQPQDQADFTKALATLERSLETPVVPGELFEWTAAVRQAIDEFQPLLAQQIRQRHDEQFVEIVEEDPELIRRVEQLKAEDAELQELAADLHSRAQRLEERSTDAEPHEAKLEEHVHDFTSDALHFVIRVRTQEQALTTWLMEAFNRDRGPVD